MNLAFPADLFEQFVEQAKVFKNGRMVYQLSLDLDRSTDERYEDYQKMISVKEKWKGIQDAKKNRQRF